MKQISLADRAHELGDQVAEALHGLVRWELICVVRRSMKTTPRPNSWTKRSTRSAPEDLHLFDLLRSGAWPSGSAHPAATDGPHRGSDPRSQRVGARYIPATCQALE
jgi:hypothetical protein